MKKLVFLFIAVVVTAFSSGVFAQNTGDFPSVGTNHEYWVNSSDNGASQNPSSDGNSYTWWISNSPTDLTVVEPEGSLFTVTSGPAYNTATVDSFKIGITWDPSSLEDTLYVVVQETDADGNLCSNLKAMPVVPQNDFELQFVALAANGTISGDSLSKCAPDIALTASGLDITYDYGTDTVMFQLNASGIFTDWAFTPTFENTYKAGVTVIPTLEYQIGGAGWSTLNSGTSVPVSANPTSNEVVLVRASWDNGDSNGTPDDGIDGQEIKLTLTDVLGSGSIPAVVVDSNNAEFTTTDTQVQTINSRPATTIIGFN